MLISFAQRFRRRTRRAREASRRIGRLLRARDEPFLPLFILGTPRTGTHLLNSFVASHPDISCLMYEPLNELENRELDGIVPGREALEYLESKLRRLSGGARCLKLHRHQIAHFGVEPEAL